MFDSSESASLWFDIFNGVLLLGAFFVLLGTWGTIKTGAIKEKFSDERTLANEAETKRAVADSDAAREGTARANERIAELTTQSEQLRKDTADANARAAEAELRLAEFRKPRLVVGADFERVVEAIKPFAGTKFDIGHAMSGREQWDFLWQFEQVFPKADWVFVEWDGPQRFAKNNWTMQPHWYGVANVLNVSIELHPEYRKELLPAAEALSKALNEIGIAASVGDKPIGGISATTNAIHILVGEKR